MLTVRLNRHVKMLTEKDISGPEPDCTKELTHEYYIIRNVVSEELLQSSTGCVMVFLSDCL